MVITWQRFKPEHHVGTLCSCEQANKTESRKNLVFVFRNMASASEASTEDSFDKTCANCKVFGWKQPEPGTSPLKRCTGCRKIYYCSKACQEEHWRKVHKKHCKFFSGRASGLDTVKHMKETCNHCIVQEASGKTVFKEGNPNFICFFDPSNNPRAKLLQELQLQYPFPLKAGNRLERIVDLLQRLLLKIQMTKQPVSRLYPREMELIADELCQIKMRIFADGVIYPSNCQVSVPLHKLDLMLPTYLKEFPDGGKFQTWKTFTTIFAMLFGVYLVQLDGMIKKPRKSLPKAQAKMSEMVRAGSYLRVVDQILDALEQRLVSQKVLAAIVCDGTLQRKCSACKKEVTVGNVSTYAGRNKGKPAVLWHLGQDNIFSCGAKGCDDQMVVRPGSETDAWHLSVYTTVNMLTSSRCAHCFLLAPLKEIHRSFLFIAQ